MTRPSASVRASREIFIADLPTGAVVSHTVGTSGTLVTGIDAELMSAL